MWLFILAELLAPKAGGSSFKFTLHQFQSSGLQYYTELCHIETDI